MDGSNVTKKGEEIILIQTRRSRNAIFVMEIGIVLM